MTAPKQKKLDKPTPTLTAKEADDIIAKGVGKVLTMEDIKPKQLETTAKDASVSKVKRTNIVELAATKKTLVDLKTPYVIVGGKVIEPDNVPDFVIDTSKSSRSFSRQHPAGGYGSLTILQKDRSSVTLKTYTVKIDGVEVKLFLDENSSFKHADIDTPWTRRGKPQPGRLGNSVVLLNSSSENDRFYDDNVLENINSKDSSYRATTLAIGNNKPGHNHSLQFSRVSVEDDNYLYGLDYSPLGEVNPEVARHEIKNSQFVFSTIRNSVITPGNYTNSHFDNVTVEVTGAHKHIYTSFKGARFYNVKLSGKHVRSHSSDLNHVNVEVDGNIVIVNIRMNSNSIYGEGANLINKFSHAIIHAPRGDLALVRTSGNSFTLATDYRYGESQKLRLDDDYVTVREVVEKMVLRSHAYPGEDQPSKDDPITRSVIKFVTDSIWSRFKLIKLIDGASSLDALVNPVREERYDHLSLDNGPF